MLSPLCSRWWRKTLPHPSPDVVAGAIRPEDQLLLDCARISMDPGRASRIRARVREGLDWASLLQKALPHGMMPLLYWHLNAACPESVPRPILDHLRSQFLRTLRTNLFLAGELLRLLERLDAVGIPAIPYKGPVLAESLYGSMALRPFRDLDLLVHAENVPRARDVLISQGYRGHFHLNRVHEAAFLRSQCELAFVRDHDGVIVELHWAITPRYFSFSLDPDRLWPRVESVSLGGRTVLSFSPEDLCLILCAHGCLHLWERLEWICDVAQVLQVHKGMNWEQLLAHARALGSERMLFLGLLLANDLLEAPLPKRVMQKVRADPAARSLALQVCHRLFREIHRPPDLPQLLLFHSAAKERLRDKLRYWFRLAVTPTPGDWGLLPLPECLSHFYYGLRPIRILGKYAPALLNPRLWPIPSGGDSHPPALIPG